MKALVRPTLCTPSGLSARSRRVRAVEFAATSRTLLDRDRRRMVLTLEELHCANDVNQQPGLLWDGLAVGAGAGVLKVAEAMASAHIRGLTEKRQQAPLTAGANAHVLVDDDDIEDPIDRTVPQIRAMEALTLLAHEASSKESAALGSAAHNETEFMLFPGLDRETDRPRTAVDLAASSALGPRDHVVVNPTDKSRVNILCTRLMTPSPAAKGTDV